MHRVPRPGAASSLTQSRATLFLHQSTFDCTSNIVRGVFGNTRGRGSPPVLPPDIRFRPKIEDMHLTVEFGGGLELLCDSVKVHDFDVEPPVGAEKLTMRDLLIWVQKNMIKERPEMFIKGDTVRPGILVLVNDCDWELSGQLDTALEEKDVVVFISTLHGG